MAPPDLKAQNARWLWAVVVLDAVMLVPATVTSSVAGGLDHILTKGVIAAAAPVIVFLLTSLLPADVKAVFIFWRLKHALPGHRAFSVYAHRDSRINLEGLKRKVGKFPVSPREQNAVWYGLFKAVEEDAGVTQAHRHFLLFRDLAALSLILSLVAVPVVLLTGGTRATVLTVCGVLIGQYLLAAVAAHQTGVRLVTNVLALK